MISINVFRLPTPKRKARTIPYATLAIAVVNESQTKTGAADVPILKIIPFKKEPPIQYLRIDLSCFTRK